ncbi:MAG: hypothetical protein ACRDE7_00830 [Sphingobacterium sp.]
MASIKERVLRIAEVNGKNKVAFFKDLGLSYANFKGVQKFSALGSDAVEIILSTYQDVSADWLISGTGEMLKHDGFSGQPLAITLPSKVGTENSSESIITALENVISAQQICIDSQKIAIESLTSRVDHLEKKHKKKKRK